eukprot:TRINITY_DN1126_c0_g1_i1.p1 TRINITY_DN1126_c0_g1~~TRINITY_DN1126_c0_g1_i1.p1  ORF type:complete len:617 (-),score=202.34 TRINITY_DN1126_c0_g1_i1:109-1959(-)
MPTVSLKLDELEKRVGEKLPEKKFDELCFEFGIELDDVTSEKEMVKKERGEEAAKGMSDDTVYKVDIPANRVDLLCPEGIARALRIFLQKESLPNFKTVEPESPLQMNVAPETGIIRPYIVCAVLRNVTMNEDAHKNFLDLQDKLHENIGRRRILGAIGTHDLDTIQGPFRYEARPAKYIEFAPLTHPGVVMTADKILEEYRTNPACKHLKSYVDIVADSPVLPIIYDSKDRVLSMPPLINSDHSKITPETKNIFIECTSTDAYKAHIILTTMVAMFSQYCEEPFSCEAVRVNYSDESHQVTPDMSPRTLSARVDEINSMLGVRLEPKKMVNLLTRLQLPGHFDIATNSVIVEVPVTRSDIIHECDIVEDVAIAYGYNNLPVRIPNTNTEGKEFLHNMVTDKLRVEVAGAGYTEALNFVLCSKEDAFDMVDRIDDDKTAVKIANPKTKDFQIVRPTLLPGLLKTLQSNRYQSMSDGFKLFEISDIVRLDDSSDVGATNRRHLSAVYCGPTAGFEIIHGLLDRVMTLLNVEETYGKTDKSCKGKRATYELRGFDKDPTFYPGRCAEVIVHFPDGETIVAGAFGVVHPKVLRNYKIKNPVSAVELNLESFINRMSSHH